MARRFDIHTGGIDLIFPHHEDEIAQSEAATGQTFVRTWLHCAHLAMGGEKMAKRTGNIERPADVYARGYSPRALRYALLAAHYRAGLEFSDASLQAAAAAVERLSTVLAALDAYRQDGPDADDLAELLASTRSAFTAGLDDDLNIAPALAAVFDLVREVNRRLAARTLSTADAARAAALHARPGPCPGRGRGRRGGARPWRRELAALLEARREARAGRDFAASDRLRDELAARGILVEDTRDGQRWRRAEEVVDA